MIDLGLDESDRNGWAVIAVSGEIDMATAPRLREQLLAMVTAGKVRIVVDLAAVDFLDSTGIGVLVGALKRARTQGGDLTLVCAESRIMKVFEITGLTKVFTIYGSVDDAVAEG